jgi:hypothetical protein
MYSYLTYFRLKRYFIASARAQVFSYSTVFYRRPSPEFCFPLIDFQIGSIEIFGPINYRSLWSAAEAGFIQSLLYLSVPTYTCTKHLPYIPDSEIANCFLNYFFVANAHTYFSNKPTDNAFKVNYMHTTALLCSPWNPIPWRDSNPGLLFLRLMRCLLRNAARARLQIVTIYIDTKQWCTS